MRQTVCALLVALLVLPGSAAARQARVSGTVVDRVTDRPLPGVSIALDPGDVHAVTDSAGRFALPELAVGTYAVRFTHDGYRTRAETLSVDRSGTMDAVILLDPTTAAPGAAVSGTSDGSVVGRIRDHETGRPLADVRIAVSGAGATGSGANGTFSIADVSAGTHTVTFELIGYETQSHEVTVESGRTIEIDLRLAQRPIELPPIEVTVRSAVLERMGFYDRRDVGAIGTFITRADIERRGPQNLGSLLQDVASVQLHRMGVRTVIRFNRMVSMQDNPLPGCEPRIWVDGRRHLDRVAVRPEFGEHSNVDDINFLSPDAIEAIEVYTHNAPLEYQHACGSIVIWTRRGGG